MIDFVGEHVLTLTAAAERLGVSQNTIRNWARGRSGKKLETATLGGRVYTSLEAIQRFSGQPTSCRATSAAIEETRRGLKKHGIILGGA